MIQKGVQEEMEEHAKVGEGREQGRGWEGHHGKGARGQGRDGERTQ